jgi:SET domain-containing protein
MEIFPPKKIKIVDMPGKGRGVVAIKNIKKDEIIEICPIIFISDKEVSFFEKEKSNLKYYYLIQTATNKFCIMLGYGSLYNHSFTPNADIDYNVKNVENFLQFEAIKDIKAGEEIFFDYEFDNNIVDFLKQD